MCQTGPADSSARAVFFDSESKCCTYMPRLWNFLVGALLEDDSPEAAAGRRTVEARIDAGVGVTPFGLARTPVYDLLYARIKDAFGRARSLRCPHYIEEGGRCGVWRARESTCATWFCKYERGAVGLEFWERLHRLLALAEYSLSAWCVLQLDPGEEAFRALIPRRPPPGGEAISAADFDHRVDAGAYRRKWGRWAGREREFYRKAGVLARALPWSQVRELGGAELQMAETLVQDAFRRLMSNEVPERLRTGAIRFTPDEEGGVLSSYSANDPIRLSHEVLGVLPFFNGQPTTAAIEAIRDERGLAVSPELVRWLVDFGILVEEGQGAVKQDGQGGQGGHDGQVVRSPTTND
jgi:Fe-S-cluster containining protein